jgi:curved DNA-binding protein CbpA
MSRRAIRNPWAVLGVSKTSSDKDIRKQYLLLAKKWHPDVNKDPAAEETFQEITEAFNVTKPVTCHSPVT